MAKRKRRAFTTEFKAQTVRLVRESGKSVGAVARELDLAETAVRRWVQQAEIDARYSRPSGLRVLLERGRRHMGAVDRFCKYPSDRPDGAHK